MCREFALLWIDDSVASRNNTMTHYVGNSDSDFMESFRQRLIMLKVYSLGRTASAFATCSGPRAFFTSFAAAASISAVSGLSKSIRKCML